MSICIESTANMDNGYQLPAVDTKKNENANEDFENWILRVTPLPERSQ